jgi:hypothetical protein
MPGKCGALLRVRFTEWLGFTVCPERTLPEKGGIRSARCFTKDEGRPLGVGLQERASNHHKLLG